MPNVFKVSSVKFEKEKPYELKETPLAINFDDEDSKENREQLLARTQFNANTIIEKANFQSIQIIENAKQTSEEIIKQSLVESDNIKVEAYRNGYEKGLANGLETASRDCRLLIEDILALKEDIELERQRLFEVFEKDIVNLAFEISKKVISDQLREDNECFEKLVKSTALKVRGVDFIKLWVSPFDHSKLLEARTRLITGIKDIKDIEVLRGESIKKWGVIIDTDSSVLDGGLETRLSQIENALNSASNL